MKQFNRIIFLRQDIFKLSTLVLIILALISGGSIIYSREFLGGPFQINTIYAMYATVSEFLLMVTATNLFGKEFHYKTINMLRVSKRSCLEIITRKLIVMIILSILTAICAFIEVELYALIFNHEINAFKIARDLFTAYCLYGIFLFTIATPIVIIFKNTFLSFVTVFVIVSFLPIITNMLSGIFSIKNFMNFIPFTFMREAFSFAKFDLSQIIIILLWSCVFFAISHKLLKDRGYL